MKLHAHIIQLGPLTQREANILAELCTAKTRHEIACELHRSIHTISRHVEHIAEKLSAHSHADIVARAVAQGLVTITLRSWLVITVCQLALADIGIDMRRTPQAPRWHHSRIMGRSQTQRIQRDS